MSNTARPKFSTTATAYFEANQTENPRKNYHSREARPPGRSGGAPPVSPASRLVLNS